MPLPFCLAPANLHDVPFARHLLEVAIQLLGIAPRVIRLDAGYWGLKLIAWIHTALGAQAVIPWNPKRQKKRDGLPPTWTAEEVGKRTSIERFFGRVLAFFRLQRPPVFGWSAVDPGGADLRGSLGHCFGRLAGQPPQLDPLAAAGVGPRLGRDGRMKHARLHYTHAGSQL